MIKLPPMPNPVSDPNPPNPVKKLAGLNTGALGSSSITAAPTFDGDGDGDCDECWWWLCWLFILLKVLDVLDILDVWLLLVVVV